MGAGHLEESTKSEQSEKESDFIIPDNSDEVPCMSVACNIDVRARSPVHFRHAHLQCRYFTLAIHCPFLCHKSPDKPVLIPHPQTRLSSPHTMSDNSPLSLLLSVTGIGSGSTWAASSLTLNESDENLPTCSSPPTPPPQDSKDPGAFSDDEFDDDADPFVPSLASGVALLYGAQEGRKLDLGAKSFVPGKASHGP